MSLESNLAEAAEFGITRVFNSADGHRWHVECSVCGTSVDRNAKPNLPANVVITTIRRSGWSLSRKHPAICPNCIKRKQPMTEEPARRKVKFANLPSEQTASFADREVSAGRVPGIPAELHMAPSAPEPVFNAKIMRQVITLLDIHFNSEKGTFALGWDDKRIADEAQTSLSYVVKMREEAYGALKDPFADIRRDLQMAKDNLVKIESDLLDQIAKGLEPIRGYITKLEFRIELKQKGQ